MPASEFIWLKDNYIEAIGNYVIEQPALLIDYEMGLLHKWGNLEDVLKRQRLMVMVDPTGLVGGTTAVIDLLKIGLNMREAYWVMRVCIEYSGYAGKIFKKLTNGEDIRIPIELCTD